MGMAELVVVNFVVIEDWTTVLSSAFNVNTDITLSYTFATA